MNRYSIFASIALIHLLLDWGSAAAYQKPPLNAKIRGTVTIAGKGQPLAGAVIDLRGRWGPLPVTTDAEGRFELADLPPGENEFEISAPGFVPATATIELNGHETTIHNFALTPFGSIDGRIVDREGRPIAGVLVQALHFTYAEFGKRQMEVAVEGRSDDRGVYRLFWIPAGRYFLLASDRRDSNLNALYFGIAPSFFPGVPATYPDAPELSNAKPLEIHPGEEIAGLDFVLDRGPARRIRGRVVDAETGMVPDDVRPGLLQFSPGSEPGITGGRMSKDDGTFEIRSVGPGPRVVAVQNTGTSAIVATVPVFVSDSDIEGLVLTVSALPPIRARVTIDGNFNAQLDSTTIHLLPWNGARSVFSGPSAPDDGVSPVEGLFDIEGIAPGQYRLFLEGNGYIKEAHWGAANALQEPIVVTADNSSALDIVVSFNTAKIVGKVVDGGLEANDGYRVVLMPVPQRDRLDLYRSAESYSDLSIENIAPGDYRLFAWRSVESNPYFDPAFVQAHEDEGLLVHVSEGSQLTVELKALP